MIYIPILFLVIGLVLVIQWKNLWLRTIGALLGTIAFWWGIDFVMYESILLATLFLILGIICFIAFFVYGETALKKDKKENKA